MSQKLFIIHGWSYNFDKWQKIVPFLQAGGFEPVLLKVPGLTEPSNKVWDIDGYIDWLDKQLKDETSPIVVGHSNGGRIALAYLQSHPDRFKQLILIDSAGLVHDTKVGNAKLTTLRVASKVGKPLAKIPLVNKAVYKLIGAQDYRQAPPNMRKTMQNMLNADKAIDLTKIKLPVTIIWGAEDTITPLKDGQKMHQLLESSEMHIVNDARHAPQSTHPEQVAELITGAVK